MEKFNFNLDSRKIQIDVKRLIGWQVFGTGLMFYPRQKAKALLFDFRKKVKFSFSSLFVFFPFFIFWLDDKDEVIDFCEVRPFCFKIPSVNRYHKVLEIPCNERYNKIIEIFRREKKFKKKSF